MWIEGMFHSVPLEGAEVIPISQFTRQALEDRKISFPRAGADLLVEVLLEIVLHLVVVQQRVVHVHQEYEICRRHGSPQFVGRLQRFRINLQTERISRSARKQLRYSSPRMGPDQPAWIQYWMNERYVSVSMTFPLPRTRGLIIEGNSVRTRRTLRIVYHPTLKLWSYGSGTGQIVPAAAVSFLARPAGKNSCKTLIPRRYILLNAPMNGVPRRLS